MAEPKFQIETSSQVCSGCEEAIAPGTRYFSAVVFEDAEQRFGRRDFCEDCWERAQAADAGAPGAGGGDAPTEFYAYWRTRRPELSDEPRAKMRFDPEIVLDFFRHLRGRRAPAGGATGLEDAGLEDAGLEDAGLEDAGLEDAGLEDAGLEDAGLEDAGGGSGLLPKGQRDLRFVLSLLLLRKKVLVFEGSAADEEGREWLHFVEKSRPEAEYWVENPDLSDEELEQVRDDIGELLGMNL